MTNAIIWSTSTCGFCIQAKRLLDTKGIVYEERMIGKGYTKDDLLKVVPNAKTVPQIFIEDEYIGGYTELMKFFASKENS